MKLKVFSDQRYLPALLPTTLRYVPILAPFWGELPEDAKHFKTRRFERLATEGTHFLEMTSLEEADLAIFPVHWHLIKSNEEDRKRGLTFIQRARELGKPVAIFSQGDWNGDENLENTIILYTSSFQSSRKSNEFAMPEWTSDFVDQNLNNQIVIREKQVKPVVGFCGYAPPFGVPFGISKIKGYLRLYGDLLGLAGKFYPKTGHSSRVIALSELSKNSSIGTNFILRQNFAFSDKALKDAPSSPERLAQKLRLEYCQNIIDSDYVVCCSGYENYSIRLYETLSFGRIPIFVNTDCVLPYDFAVDWKKYCVCIDKSELNLIADKVADFHNRLSAQEFIDLQHECRKFWKEWLSPEGFFRNFYRHLNVTDERHASQAKS